MRQPVRIFNCLDICPSFSALIISAAATSSLPSAAQQRHCLLFKWMFGFSNSPGKRQIDEKRNCVTEEFVLETQRHISCDTCSSAHCFYSHNCFVFVFSSETSAASGHSQCPTVISVDPNQSWSGIHSSTGTGLSTERSSVFSWGYDVSLLMRKTI